MYEIYIYNRTQKEAEEKQTRISQLHNEQVRAWRKIDQIRKRAADLMKFKLNKEEKLERVLNYFYDYT